MGEFSGSTLTNERVCECVRRWRHQSDCDRRQGESPASSPLSSLPAIPQVPAIAQSFGTDTCDTRPRWRARDRASTALAPAVQSRSRSARPRRAVAPRAPLLQTGLAPAGDAVPTSALRRFRQLHHGCERANGAGGNAGHPGAIQSTDRRRRRNYRQRRDRDRHSRLSSTRTRRSPARCSRRLARAGAARTRRTCNDAGQCARSTFHRSLEQALAYRRRSMRARATRSGLLGNTSYHDPARRASTTTARTNTVVDRQAQGK
jgi:hypothetical protein